MIQAESSSSLSLSSQKSCCRPLITFRALFWTPFSMSMSSCTGQYRAGPSQFFRCDLNTISMGNNKPVAVKHRLSISKRGVQEMRPRSYQDISATRHFSGQQHSCGESFLLLKPCSHFLINYSLSSCFRSNLHFKLRDCGLAFATQTKI